MMVMMLLDMSNVMWEVLLVVHDVVHMMIDGMCCWVMMVAGSGWRMSDDPVVRGWM